MKNTLHLGTISDGREFVLPADMATRTLAIIAIRGAGKTVAATVVAEEMCEAGIPWTAFDPAGVWWGLRVKPDGIGEGYPVVIIGGPHGDLELDKNAGTKIAEAIIDQNVFCVIDVSLESKTTWRKFITDFCDKAMELVPPGVRHFFIEEAPEFVPQRPLGEQKRSLAAVDRLLRLGRNRGYGCTVLSQRFATINKDVLTQACENILAMRSIGKPDRAAAKDWIVEQTAEMGEDDIPPGNQLDMLPSLPDGVGYFWSAQWLKVFEKIKVRERKTLHPGATRAIGGRDVRQIKLVPMDDAIARLRRILAIKVAVPNLPRESVGSIDLTQPFVKDTAAKLQQAEQRSQQLETQINQLRESLRVERDARQKAESVLARVRKTLEPEYQTFQILFGDLAQVSTNGHGSTDASMWEPWKQKLGKGAARIIDILLERGELTRVQLKTLAGYSRQNMANIVSSLNSNQLIEKDGDKIRLRTI